MVSCIRRAKSPQGMNLAGFVVVNSVSETTDTLLTSWTFQDSFHSLVVGYVVLPLQHQQIEPGIVNQTSF